MKKLEKVMKKKKWADLKPRETEEIHALVSQGNLIEPTEEMIEEVIEMHLQGKDVGEIKRTVTLKEKRKNTHMTLSKGQIKEIIYALKNRQTELKPAKEADELD